MFDRFIIQKLESVRRAVARLLFMCKIKPNVLSAVGFLIGLFGAYAISRKQFLLGLFCILGNRILDGLDGPLAYEFKRQGKPHNAKLGGYLDAVFDFIFYSAIPTAFIISDPLQNAVAGAVLMLAFMTTCVSFFAFAAVNPSDTKLAYQHNKSFRYLGGLTEGFETIIFFVILCLLPEWFSLFAWIFAGMCFFTGATRVWITVSTLRRGDEKVENQDN